MRRRLVQLVIVVAAVAVGAWLWLWSGQEEHGRGLRGGPLFDFSADQVVALEIRRPTGTSVLSREGEGWTLDGQVKDLVDPERLAPVLAQLIGGWGDPVLAGTEPDERRFGFGSGDAVELVFRLAGGGQRRLALGEANPVSQRVYASGAGRVGVFGVGGELYVAAARLPDSVRLPRLLPGLALADLDSLQIERRGGATLPFARLADGRWWLRLPGGLAALQGIAARYHEFYQDRRRRQGGADWVLADRRRLRELVYRASDTDVVALPSPPEAGGGPAAAELGLEPPYRGLVLFRRQGEPWRLELGEMQQEERALVGVRRQGTLVIARGEALVPLEGPLSDFLDLGALSFRLEAADTLWIDEAERPLLWGAKAPDPEARRRELKSIWDPLVPPGWQPGFAPEVLANHLGDIQTTLDRLPCLEVRPPAAESPLRAGERWRLRAALSTGERVEVWLGRLRDEAAAAVWDPTDGKLLTVPQEILVTLRNLRHDLHRGG